jgi:tetratricopeptide (TPR) repeat protein
MTVLIAALVISTYRPAGAMERGEVQRSIDLLKRGDTGGAIARLSMLISRTPDDPDAYDLRGAAHIRRNEISSAIDDLSAALRIDGRRASARVNRGLALRYKGDYDRSIADLDEAVRIDPRYASAYFNRALTFRDKGDRARSLTDFAEAVRLDPRYEKDVAVVQARRWTPAAGTTRPADTSGAQSDFAAAK